MDEVDKKRCSDCVKCGNGCDAGPDSPVHDCPDYEPKLLIPVICDTCSKKGLNCTPTDRFSCTYWELDPKVLPEKPKDEVNHPDHYTQGGIECIDCIKASMSKDGFEDYCKGNVIKYLHRWRFKGGVQDLKKASVYLNWLIESAENGKILYEMV